MYQQDRVRKGRDCQVVIDATFECKPGCRNSCFYSCRLECDLLFNKCCLYIYCNVLLKATSRINR